MSLIGEALAREDSSGPLFFTSEITDLSDCEVFIITVPTPINEFKAPDLTPLQTSSRSVGGVIKKGTLVIYESTTYPGCTEEVCVPELENASGFVFNKDFFVIIPLKGLFQVTRFMVWLIFQRSLQDPRVK